MLKRVVYIFPFNIKIWVYPEVDPILSSLIYKHEEKIESLTLLADKWEYDEEFTGKIPKLRGLGYLAHRMLLLMGLSEEKLTLHVLRREVEDEGLFPIEVKKTILNRAFELIRENDLQGLPIVVKLPRLRLFKVTERFYIYEVLKPLSVVLRIE